MAMQIGKISAQLPKMHSDSRSYDNKRDTDERELAKKLPTTDDYLPNKNKVKQITSQINDFIGPIQTNLKFEYHEDLNEYYVTVVNPDTKEIIKEIPPKKMLDMYAAMVEFMGMLIDEKV